MPPSALPAPPTPAAAPGPRLSCGSGPWRAPSRGTGGAAAILGVWAHITRGPAAWIVGIAVLASAHGLSGRAGLGPASAFVAFNAGYCVLNFWSCREAHCAVTGPGFALAAALGTAAAAVPPGDMPWYPVDIEIAAFLAVLLLGFAFEAAYGRRMHRRRLS